MTKTIKMLVTAALIAAPMMAKAADNATPSSAETTTTTSSDKHPNCKPDKSKPCGHSCIALYKVCHKE